MISTRRARRLTFGIGAATAAAILAGAGTLAATSASAAPNRPAVAQCISSNLTLWTAAQSDGAAGTFTYQVELSNVGRHTCTLQGYPGVSAVNGTTQVGLPASHSGARPLVTIAPGGTAHFVLKVADPGAACSTAHPPTAHQLRVYAPGQFKALQTEFTVSVCPHTVSMRVDGVHQNAGIPGHTTF
jgi:hypothetical protein